MSFSLKIDTGGSLYVLCLEPVQFIMEISAWGPGGAGGGGGGGKRGAGATTDLHSQLPSLWSNSSCLSLHTWLLMYGAVAKGH